VWACRPIAALALLVLVQLLPLRITDTTEQFGRATQELQRVEQVVEPVLVLLVSLLPVVVPLVMLNRDDLVRTGPSRRATGRPPVQDGRLVGVDTAPASAARLPIGPWTRLTRAQPSRL
jgi:hypothetical protein